VGAVIGKDSFEQPLSDSDVRLLCEEALASIALDGKGVLVLIPDHTRHARLGLFFRIFHELLGRKVRALDYLIASGTHAPMEMERIYRHVGITASEHRTTYGYVRFFNHEHNNPEALTTIGTIPADEISRLTSGVFSEPLDVTINRKLLEYDHLLLVTPVVTHETIGFAGGNKYFFPGSAGLEVIETIHWLGAILTNLAVNGVKDTPTRRIVDRVAEFIPTPRTCFAFAVNDLEQPMCLFVGEPKESWSRAADYSAKLHVTYVDHPYRTILSVTPDIYEDMWVGGKAMYKLEPVAAEGGEVIIYGPQIRAISFTHEQAIRRIGYHVIEYFTKQWNRFRKEPKLIMAHSTNVRGMGTFKNGVEHARVQVTLATSIPEEVCRSVNLGYRDYRTIDLDKWRSRQTGDLIVVENAGQNLYRLKN
jgi:nickel-dependent lactate racemase